MNFLCLLNEFIIFLMYYFVKIVFNIIHLLIYVNVVQHLRGWQLLNSSMTSNDKK